MAVEAGYFQNDQEKPRRWLIDGLNILGLVFALKGQLIEMGLSFSGAYMLRRRRESGPARGRERFA